MIEIDHEHDAEKSGLGVDPNLFGAMLDAVPDAVVVVDATGCIRAANRQVRDVFGWEPHELEGEQVEVLVPARIRVGHPAIRSGYSHRPMGLLQLSAVRHDGEEFPAEISLAPVAIGAGESLTVATIRDITERLSLEADAERVRDELLATVTHELRTPLTSILGYAEIMEELDDDELGPEARRMLAVVQRNAERELKLVTDLLTVAVTTLGSTKLSLAPVDLADLVQEAGAGHAESARAAGLVLVTTADRGSDDPEQVRLTIDGDAHRLMQVLDNLLSNAIKFSPSGGVVTLTVQALADSVVLAVGDSGAGIPVADQGRIFERLYRGQNALDAEAPGAGLGLAIVQSIVTAHRGTVRIESQPGTGTLATVQLPRAD
jgi:protein-histidine pros-kinase